MDAGRATIDAVMPDGQSCVVDAEQVKNGSVKIIVQVGQRHSRKRSTYEA
jgi:hypothetical protein